MDFIKLADRHITFDEIHQIVITAWWISSNLLTGTSLLMKSIKSSLPLDGFHQTCWMATDRQTQVMVFKKRFWIELGLHLSASTPRMDDPIGRMDHPFVRLSRWAVHSQLLGLTAFVAHGSDGAKMMAGTIHCNIRCAVVSCIPIQRDIGHVNVSSGAIHCNMRCAVVSCIPIHCDIMCVNVSAGAIHCDIRCAIVSRIPIHCDIGCVNVSCIPIHCDIRCVNVSLYTIHCLIRQLKPKP
jgi:hypothetical protein